LGLSLAKAAIGLKDIFLAGMPKFRSGSVKGMQMLRAYLDASSNDTHDVIAVGGVLARDEQWAGFIPAWQRMLDSYGLRRFHAAEYWSRKGQFARLNEADHAALRRNICRIFKLFKPLAVATIVGGAAFQAWRPGQKTYLHPDGQYLALDHALNSLLARANDHPVDEVFVIYCDKDAGHEKLMSELTEWQTFRIRNMVGLSPGDLNRQRASAVQFGLSIDVIALQAANLIAHSAFRWGRDHLKGGNIEEPFLAGIKPECSIALNPLITKEYIDREQRILENRGLV
jgi:hypothetical protein